MSEEFNNREFDIYKQVGFQPPADDEFASRVRGIAIKRRKQAQVRNTVGATVMTMILISGIYLGANWMDPQGRGQVTPDMFADLENQSLITHTTSELAQTDIDLEELTVLTLMDEDTTTSYDDFYNLFAGTESSDDPVETLTGLDDQSLEEALQWLEDTEIELCPQC